MVACFFSCGGDDGEWLPHPPGSQLWQLAGHTSRVQLLLRLCHADAAAVEALPYFDVSRATAGGARCEDTVSVRPLCGATVELARPLSEELGRLELKPSFVHGELLSSICGRGRCKAPSPDDLPLTELKATVRRQASGNAAGQRSVADAVDPEAVRTGAGEDAEDSDLPSDKEASPFCPRVLFQATIKATQPYLLSALLLESGTNVHAVDLKGNSVMHFWARATIGRDHLMTIGAELLSAGADLNAQRTDGMSPLHHVCSRQNSRRGWLNFHKAVFLLKHGAKPWLRTRIGQFPGDMLRGEDTRLSTQRLKVLLRAAASGQAAHGWPTCDMPTCSWCGRLCHGP